MSSTGTTAARQSGRFTAGVLGGMALAFVAMRWLPFQAVTVLVLAALGGGVASRKSVRFLGLGVLAGVIAVAVFLLWLFSTCFEDLDKMG